MSAPIRFLEDLTSPTFLEDIKGRYREYQEYCSKQYDDSHTKGNKIIFYDVHNTNGEITYEDKATLVIGKNYWVNCYSIRENNFLKEIEIFIYSSLDKDKNAVYINLQINSIEHLVKTIKNHATDEGEVVNLINKLNTLSDKLKDLYLKKIMPDTSEPKIRWVGDLKVLTTLFYEMLHGQIKGHGRERKTTLPMIEAKKKDLQELLLNNFLKSDGERLNPKTINDYLNSSKPQHRSPEKERFEFPE